MKLRGTLTRISVLCLMVGVALYGCSWMVAVRPRYQEIVLENTLDEPASVQLVGYKYDEKQERTLEIYPFPLPFGSSDGLFFDLQPGKMQRFWYDTAETHFNGVLVQRGILLTEISPATGSLLPGQPLVVRISSDAAIND